MRLGVTCVINASVFSNVDSLEKFVDFIVIQFLAKTSKHYSLSVSLESTLTIFQFANANITCSVLVKYLKSANKVFRLARSPKTIRSIKNAEEQIEIN